MYDIELGITWSVYMLYMGGWVYVWRVWLTAFSVEFEMGAFNGSLNGLSD